MNHGITNDILCTACKIEVRFKDDQNTEKTGYGTAFFVKNVKGEVCLLTNRHVVDLDYKQPTSKYKNFKLTQVVVHNKERDKTTGLPTDSNDLLILNHNEFIFSDNYQNDIACLKAIRATDLNGKSPRVSFFIDYDVIADEKRINEKLVVCDLVAFPGFPDWYDKKNNLPILRTGTIASDPRFDYSYSGSDDGGAIAYEAFSYGGSSGSPIFAVQKGIKVGEGLKGGDYREIMLIGINAGHLPITGLRESHSGISYFYKSSIIIELINK